MLSKKSGVGTQDGEAYLVLVYRYEVFVAGGFGQVFGERAIPIVAIVSIVPEDWCFSTDENVSRLESEGGY